MAVKEILDVLGENPTQAVYNEGKNFVTRKIKLHIDKEKLENYVKEAYNRQTIVYASKKFAYEGFMEYISSKAFINEVEEILVETDYVKREKRKSELIAEGISYIEKSDTIAQEQAKELVLIGIEAVLKYMSKQIEPSLRMVINNQAGDIICQVKKELNEAIQKLIQELMPKKRKVKPCPVQPQNISNELIPPIEYVGSEKVPENEKYDYGKDDEKDSVYPMLRILKEHQESRFFQLEGIGTQTCGGVGKTYTLYGVMNQVNNAGKNPAVYLSLKKVYSGFSDESRNGNRLLAEVKKQLEEDECNNALLLLDGYNELPSITCQMNFILDIASYQEQYPNSTIVVASRTKMQYADAHAFVSGDADYASLEILNELKHCYILVLERAAIEKAIGAKIETQEEYETLSTPFYITLYKNTDYSITREYTKRWVTKAQEQSYKERKKSKTALLIAQMIREIEKLGEGQGTDKTERKAFVLTKVFPVIGYQLYQIAIVQEDLANSGAILSERKVTLKTLHDIIYQMLDFFKDYPETLQGFPEYEDETDSINLFGAWENFIKTKIEKDKEPKKAFGSAENRLNTYIPVTEMPFDILTYDASKGKKRFSFSHDNYQDFFAAFHIANVYWMILHSRCDWKELDELQYKIFCLQLDATERSVLIMAIEILNNYYGVGLQLKDSTFYAKIEEFLQRDMDPVARLTALNIAIRFIETNLSVEDESGLRPMDYEKKDLHDRFATFCRVFECQENEYVRNIYATFYTYVKCLLARDSRVGRGEGRDLLESLAIAAEAKKAEKDLHVARADGCMQIGLTLSSAMDQFLNADGTEQLLETVWIRTQEWLEPANRINQLLENCEKHRDTAEIKEALKNEFGEKCLANKEFFDCTAELLTMLHTAKNKYDAETDETLKKIYGLGYISKAMLIFAALGSSVGAMNRIALMFMNQQDECEQDSRLALYKTNPLRVKGVNYTDNYLTAWKIFYAGTCIFRSTQGYSRLKVGEFVFKNFVGFENGVPVQRATQQCVPEEPEVDDNNFTLMLEHIDIAERNHAVMSTYWRGRAWQEHGIRVHDTTGFYESNAVQCFDATNVSKMDFEEQRSSRKPLPYPKMVNLIELVGYPDKIPSGERLDQVHEFVMQAIQSRIQEYKALDYKINSESYHASTADFRYEIGRYKRALCKRGDSSQKINEVIRLEKTI